MDSFPLGAEELCRRLIFEEIEKCVCNGEHLEGFFPLHLLCNLGTTVGEEHMGKPRVLKLPPALFGEHTVSRKCTNSSCPCLLQDFLALQDGASCFDQIVHDEHVFALRVSLMDLHHPLVALSDLCADDDFTRLVSGHHVLLRGRQLLELLPEPLPCTVVWERNRDRSLEIDVLDCLDKHGNGCEEDRKDRVSEVKTFLESMNVHDCDLCGPATPTEGGGGEKSGHRFGSRNLSL
mmetsp:Transcript_51860/g.101584  ORF Transcript_51860/g.101584 Transcript_51860/m.101584 type:complete len:235 (-) Transcript_51860:583-1287(-)